MSRVPKRFGIQTCDNPHCRASIRKEKLRLTYEVNGSVVAEKVWCSHQCQLEEHDELIKTEVDKQVREELNRIYKLVPPSIRKLLM